MKKFSVAFITALSAVILIISLTVYADAGSKQSVPSLTASNIGSTENRLSWTKVDGAGSYIVYLLNEKTNKYEKYAEVKGTVCRDKNLLPNTEYTYKVRPRFSDGSIGKMSGRASVYTSNKYGSSFYNALQGKNNMPDIYAAVQGDRIYFSLCLTDSPFNCHSEYGVLYRMKTDGTNLETIKNNCFASYINAVGSRLYYIDVTNDITNDNGRTYTICSCDLDGKNTETIVKDKELENYDDWDSYAVEELKVIDDQVIFNVSALEGWRESSNIYALSLNSGGKPVKIAGYGYTASDDLSENHTAEDEAAEMKAAAEAEVHRVMSEGMFTDTVLRRVYHSPHLKDAPDVEKVFEPQEKWLCAYDGKLYLCDKNENKVVDNNYNDSSSALLYEDTVYYVKYDKAKKTNYLMRYKNGRKTKLYGRENAGYKFIFSDGGKIYFIEKTHDSSAETASLGIYSVNTDGSELKLLWECKYE